MLYLIRHGQTYDNNLEIYYSTNNSKLNEKGFRQSNLIGQYLLAKNIDLLLCSNTERSIQTAKAILNYINVPFVIEENLNERNVGLFSNLHRKNFIELRQEYEHSFIDPTQDWYNVDDDIIESDLEVFKRSYSLIELYFQTYENIACITHAGVIKSFLHQILEMNTKRTNSFYIKNGCIIEIKNANTYKESIISEFIQLYDK